MNFTPGHAAEPVMAKSLAVFTIAFLASTLVMTPGGGGVAKYEIWAGAIYSHLSLHFPQCRPLLPCHAKLQRSRRWFWGLQLPRSFGRKVTRLKKKLCLKCWAAPSEKRFVPLSWVSWALARPLSNKNKDVLRTNQLVWIISTKKAKVSCSFAPWKLFHSIFNNF